MEQTTTQESYPWVQDLPDGAVSVEMEGTTLVLRASHTLQERFETLLARRKAGTLSPEETRAYEAICALDTELSWLNRQQFPPIAPMPYVTMMSEQSAGDLTSIGL